ncbi:MAG: DMT family transporter [Synechococcus sp.]
MSSSSTVLPSKRASAVAYLTLWTALLAVSFAPIFIRLCETELGPNGTVLNRMLVFFVVFGTGRLMSRWQAQTPSLAIEENSIEEDKTQHEAGQAFSVRQWALLLGVGTISVTSLVLWAMSLQYTTVAKSMLLNNLTPIFTTLGSWLLFGKRFNRQFLVGMAIALAGAIGLAFEDLHSANGLLIGDIYALLSAVFLGAYFLVVEQLRRWFSATTILLWRCGVGSALLIPLVWGTEGQLLPTTEVAILAALGLGIVSEGLGQRLLADCMDKFSSSFISLFLLLEPLVSALLAWAIFFEPVGPTTWVSFAVILGGIYLAQASGVATHAVTDGAVETEIETSVEVT